MKTPMQEMYDQLKASKKDEYGSAFAIDMLLENEESMLEKEKEVMCEFSEFIAEDHWRLHNVDYQINLYEWKHADGDVKTTNELFETFNTEEK